VTKRVRIGTRGSQLALWQANEVSARLAEAGYRPDIVIVKTTGDRRQDVPLSAIGGKGMFIKELEEAMARGEIDVAVHSLKDIPSIVPDGFVLAGYLERADPRDVWIHLDGTPLERLPPGSVVGTGSPRRRAQLGLLYPRLLVEPIRGNVDSRIRILRDGKYEGVILAAAGLTRLGRDADITSWFSVDEMLPAAGQGIIAIETRADDGAARAAAEAITHLPTSLVADCERGVLARFGERLDCHSSIAVHATLELSEVVVRAFASDPEGVRAVKAIRRGLDPDTVVEQVYQDLIAAGAMELLWQQ
jgi:hydroxymethylbilane synthase